jgi:hypothetical protein
MAGLGEFPEAIAETNTLLEAMTAQLSKIALDDFANMLFPFLWNCAIYFAI